MKPLTDHLRSPRTAQLLRQLAAAGGRLSARLEGAATDVTLASMDDATFVDAVYRELLGRAPDEGGREHFLAKLRAGGSRASVRAALAGSPEHKNSHLGRMTIEAFHQGRVQWVKSLPLAKSILDLGGTSLGSPLGSLLVMGYPYDFDDLTIVELPADERHELYRDEESSGVQSAQGPVRYLFRSMTDLADVPSQSIDLVMSGQTFEHITQDEGRLVLRNVVRVLKPTGFLALDTPNRTITAVECAAGGMDWINPDHKIEYTHAQMLALFDEAGLDVESAFGIGYLPQTARTATWHPEELIANPGMYRAIQDCYALAYLARPAASRS